MLRTLPRLPRYGFSFNVPDSRSRRAHVSAGSAILALAFALSAFVQPDRALALIQLGTAWPDGRVKVCWRADAVTHTDHAASEPWYATPSRTTGAAPLI